MFKVYRNYKYTIEEIKKLTPLVLNGYSCISTVYIDNRSKLIFRCPFGHIYKVSWSVFLNRKGCQICKKTFTGKEFGKDRIYRDKKWLQDQYINKKKSSKEIGKLCRVGHRLILSWLYRFDIPVRDTSTSTTFGQYNDHSILNLKVDKDKKICLRCKKIRKKTKFSRSSNNKDGLQIYCKTCMNSIVPKENGWRKYTKKELQKLEDYRGKVKVLSNNNFIKYYYLINPSKLPRSYREYHMDHIYTVLDGFNNNVSIEVIASPVNLQMLTAFDNISKGNRSDMTKEELYSLYNQFNGEVMNE